MQNYIKQAWASLAKQPLVSAVSVAGTALAIFLIMVVVMMEEVQIAPYSPESARDRWLVQKWGSITNDTWAGNGESNGPLSYATIKNTIGKMKTPETYTVLQSWTDVAQASAPGGVPISRDRRQTDHRYWQVMDFTFVDGQGYDEGDFEAGSPVAVIDRTTARAIFGTDKAAGREFSIERVPYRVKGVVDDVTPLAGAGYANIWIPFSSTSVIDDTWNTHMGMLGVIILPRSKEDIPAVREEYDKVWAEFGAAIAPDGWRFIPRGRPYDQYASVHTLGANVDPDIAAARRQSLMIYLVLLLVPAINLSSMTHSRLRQRREEIGVRRAFGAKRSEIMTDLLIENFLITVAAGLIGMLMSVLFATLGADTLLAGKSVTWHVTHISPSILLRWSTFAWALFFCFILNVLSATLPAWQAARTNIVNALAGKK